jgi:hypothetical protein
MEPRQRAKRGQSKAKLAKEAEELSFILPLRKSYDGGPFQLYISSKSQSRLTAIARAQIVLDHKELSNELLKEKIEEKDEKILALEAENRMLRERRKQRGKLPSSKLDEGEKNDVGRPTGVSSLIANHYGISKQAVTSIVRLSESAPSVSPKKRPGRKRQGTPNQRELRTSVKIHFNKV